MDHQKQWYQSQRTLPDSSTTHTNGGDWQEEVYQKIILMKEMYLPELSEIYGKIANKLRQHESLPGQTTSDQLEKLKMFKTMLERLITVLQLSKSSISPGLKEKLSLYEKQIINFINTNRPRKPVSSLHLPPSEMHNAHLVQQPKVEQQDSNDHDFISQTNDSSGADWQEEVYQKIKVMKETYLPELSKMYQKIASKLHEQEPLLRPPHMLEKLKMFKTMLERLITVLQLSKSSISPGLKKKLSLYEKQIINFINTNRPRKPVSSLHLPPSEMQLPKVEQQDQSASNLVPTEGQKCQPHPSQKKYFPIQFQLGHMQQHQLSLQQQSNPVHHMQQRVQASGQVSGAILQPPNTMELQNQLYQSHRSLLENSSTSLDSPAQIGHTDWQEETYQKILVMKHLYFAELSEMYWKIATKLQLDSHLQQQTCDQHKKLSMFKNKLEGLMTVLHHSKTEISLDLKEKLFSYEKQITDIINTNKLRLPVAPFTSYALR